MNFVCGLFKSNQVFLPKNSANFFMASTMDVEVERLLQAGI
jgi:hypothetical protein